MLGTRYGLDFSDSRDPMLIFADSRNLIFNTRDPIRVPENALKNLLYACSSTYTLLISCVIARNINYQRSKLGYGKKIYSTLRHSSPKLQNIRLQNRGVKHIHHYVRTIYNC